MDRRKQDEKQKNGEKETEKEGERKEEKVAEMKTFIFWTQCLLDK